MKKETIIRMAHNRENPYAQISKKVLKDNRLSAKAKGIMAYLLCLPDDWRICIEELTTHFSDGEKSITSGVNELILIGYIERYQERLPNGRFTPMEMIVHEDPLPNPTLLPEPHLRRPAKRRPENGTLQKTDKQKTDKLKNNNKEEVVNHSDLNDLVVVNLINVLIEKGLSKKRSEGLVLSHGKERIEEVLDQLELVKPANEAGWIVMALRDGYRFKHRESKPLTSISPYPTPEETKAYLDGRGY